MSNLQAKLIHGEVYINASPFSLSKRDVKLILEYLYIKKHLNKAHRFFCFPLIDDRISQYSSKKSYELFIEMDFDKMKVQINGTALNSSCEEQISEWIIYDDEVNENVKTD